MRIRYAWAVIVEYHCFLLSLLVLGGLLGPAQARSLAEIQQTKELRACIAPTRPSYAVATPPGCRDNCTFSGPVYEAVAAFAATLGQDIQLKLVRVDWDEQFHNREGKTEREASYTPELLASGTCDVYPTHFAKYAWRLKKLAMVTLIPNRMMVIVNQAHKAGFQTPADLAGKIAAVGKDTNYHTWLQAQNNSIYAANPVRFLHMDSGDAIQAVERGDVDFMLLNSDGALWSSRHQFKNAVGVFQVGPLEESGWGFRKEDTDLQAAVQAFFEAQRADPNSALNKLWKKSYGLSLPQFITLVTAIK